MRSWIMLTLLMVLALGSLAGLTGCATPSPEAAADLRVPDRELEKNVASRLNQDMVLSRAAIRPVSDEGVVTLHGLVNSEAQRMRAMAITRATPGVLGVIDQLKRF